MKIICGSISRGQASAIVLIGASIHLGLLFQVFTLKSVAGLLFPLVVLAPWLLLVVADRLAGQRPAARNASFVSSLAYLGFGAWAFWDTIYVHRDAQGGLIFIVIPVAASLVAGALILTLMLTRRGTTMVSGELQ